MPSAFLRGHPARGRHRAGDAMVPPACRRRVPSLTPACSLRSPSAPGHRGVDYGIHAFASLRRHPAGGAASVPSAPGGIVPPPAISRRHPCRRACRQQPVRPLCGGHPCPRRATSSCRRDRRLRRRGSRRSSVVVCRADVLTAVQRGGHPAQSAAASMPPGVERLAAKALTKLHFPSSLRVIRLLAVRFLN